MSVTLEERIKYLKAQRPKIERRIWSACKDATIRAVEKAADMTPVGIEKPLAGTNTRTSGMKQDWAAKSRTVPVKKGSAYATELNNDMEYASYVDQGHRMDRHFVPGLVINQQSGMLEFNPDGTGGIVVGTKTKYVKGLFMVDAAKEEYKRVLRQELADIGDILE